LLGASEYLATIHGVALGRPPALDLDAERRVQAVALAAIRAGHVLAAHDCSEGGLAVAVAEGCIAGNVGATLTLAPTGRWDVALFNEAPSRIVVAVRPADVTAVIALAAAQAVAATVLGTTGGPHLTCAPVLRVALAGAASAWGTAI
jgi:phosphoribosylformylglycinamidine synthase